MSICSFLRDAAYLEAPGLGQELLGRHPVLPEGSPRAERSISLSEKQTTSLFCQACNPFPPALPPLKNESPSDLGGFWQHFCSGNALLATSTGTSLTQTHIAASSRGSPRTWEGMETGSGLHIPGKSLEAAAGRREVAEPGFPPRGSAGLGAKPSTSLKIAQKQFPPGQEARPARLVCALGCAPCRPQPGAWGALGGVTASASVKGPHQGPCQKGQQGREGGGK